RPRRKVQPGEEHEERREPCVNRAGQDERGERAARSAGIANRRKHRVPRLPRRPRTGGPARPPPPPPAPLLLRNEGGRQSNRPLSKGFFDLIDGHAGG